MTRVILLLTFAVVSCGDGLAGNESHISRATFGEGWPLTVDEGILACSDQAVTFTTNGVTYGVNGTAKSSGLAPIDPIWTVAPTPRDILHVQRLSESERQAIFAALLKCEDDAETAARAKFGDDLTRAYREAPAFEERCESAVRKTYLITVEEQGLIVGEGATMGWPPIPPTRVSLMPLISYGLQLCN